MYVCRDEYMYTYWDVFTYVVMNVCIHCYMYKLNAAFISTYICPNIHIYIYIHPCIHPYIHLSLHTFIFIPAFVHIHSSPHTCIFIPAFIPTYMYMSIHVWMNVCMQGCMQEWMWHSMYIRVLLQHRAGMHSYHYGVASVSRINRIIGLFCKRAL